VPARLFVSDCDSATVYRVADDGRLRRFAGTAADDRVAADEAPASASALRCPAGLLLESSGITYVADAGLAAVRLVDDAGSAVPARAGAATPVAGHGLALRPLLRSRDAAAVDLEHLLYVGDLGNNRVLRLDPTGRLTLLSGEPEDVPAEAARRERTPARRSQLAVDRAGNVYFADPTSSRVLRVDTDHLVTVVAGTGVAVSSGDGGPASKASLDKPRGVAFDRGGRLYVSEGGGRRVRRIDRDGTISTVAGGGVASTKGESAQVDFSNPGELAVDSAGRLYVVDTGAGVVWRIARDGTVTQLGR
jgi:sugar lactone lactonase YvrE